MATKSILSFFTSGGAPVEGLTPTVKIRDTVDGTLIISESSMVEVGDGFYRYDFLQYDVTGTYAIRTDGGKTLASNERFQAAGNESFADDIWQQPSGTQDVTGTMGGALNFVQDIEGGRWEILTSSNEMVFYKADNQTEVARFNLLDITGSFGFDNPFQRQRSV